METVNNAIMAMSDAAYAEFKNFLASNNITDTNVRISLAGHACSGPRFGLMIDQAKENDATVTVKDLNFMVDKELFEEFEGFQILSSEENFGQGMVLRPNKVVESEDGCSSCSGC